MPAAALRFPAVPVPRCGPLALAGLLAALAGPGCTRPEPPVADVRAHPETDTSSAAATDAWHAERIAALTAPDGWLSLVTLAWLEPGENRVGRGPDDAVSHAGLPHEAVGTITIDRDGDGDRVHFDPLPGVAVAGLPEDSRLLTDADPDGPTSLTVGRCTFAVIERGGRLAVRMRDPESPARTGFAGIERYPHDPAWRIEATFVPAAADTTIAVDSVIGTVDDTAVVGRARFEHAGTAVDLVLHPGGAPDRHFVVFGDTTNGDGTYPAGRFLLAEQTAPGTVVLDFNRAYNPPCAFTDYATCPLPVPGNRLPFAVTAGERRPSAGGRP